MLKDEIPDLSSHNDQKAVQLLHKRRYGTLTAAERNVETQKRRTSETENTHPSDRSRVDN